MADNIDVTAGSGKTVAADEVSGVLHQRVKISIGPDGSANDVSLAYPLPSSDAGPAWTSVFGVSGALVASADMTSAANVTDAPTAGQKIVITDILVSVDTAMNVLFEEETSGTDLLKVFIPANGTIQITPRGKLKLATADKKITAKASVAGNISITVFYYSEV